MRVMPLLGGDLGSYQTLSVMRGLARRAITDPLVVETARAIVRVSPPRDAHAHALAVRDYLSEHFQFIRDPRYSEQLATPRHMLEAIARRYVVQGDCDEAATLAAALGLAVGLRARFVALGFQNQRTPLAHVYTVLGAGPMGWVSVDVTRPPFPVPPVTTRLVSMEV